MIGYLTPFAGILPCPLKPSSVYVIRCKQLVPSQDSPVVGSKLLTFKRPFNTVRSECPRPIPYKMLTAW